MEAKMAMQQITEKLDDVECSSSVPFSLTGEHLTRSQGGNYVSALEDGNLLLIRPRITILSSCIFSIMHSHMTMNHVMHYENFNCRPSLSRSLSIGQIKRSLSLYLEDVSRT